MALKLSEALARAMADLVGQYVDSAATPGKLVVYSGTRPAYPDNPVTDQIALVTFTLPDPSFAPAVTEGINRAKAVMNLPEPVPADATGQAAWFRFFNGDNVGVVDGTVGTTGSSSDLWLNSLSVVANINVAITGLSISQPL